MTRCARVARRPLACATRARRHDSVILAACCEPRRAAALGRRVARSLLGRRAMTTFAAFSFVLLALCTPALADSADPPRPVSARIRFSLHEASVTRSFDVMVSDEQCAFASTKHADQRIEIKACVQRGTQLMIDWEVRSAAGEYRSTSSMPFEHGATAELGSSTGPRLRVTIE